MALFNYATRELSAKIVYYGPGLSGKTTNIEMVHRILRPEQKGRLISLPTETDRTLFFDFLPLDLGEIKGFKVRFHLYTVPGQVFYNATRRLVLQGVDGVVFVADSQTSMLQSNIESLRNLRDNLSSYGKTIESIPFVLQYNKRDLSDIVPVGELAARLNPSGAPAVEAVAIDGRGVTETLVCISRMVFAHLRKTLLADEEVAGEAGPDDWTVAAGRESAGPKDEQAFEEIAEVEEIPETALSEGNEAFPLLEVEGGDLRPAAPSQRSAPAQTYGPARKALEEPYGSDLRSGSEALPFVPGEELPGGDGVPAGGDAAFDEGMPDAIEIPVGDDGEAAAPEADAGEDAHGGEIEIEIPGIDMPPAAASAPAARAAVSVEAEGGGMTFLRFEAPRLAPGGHAVLPALFLDGDGNIVRIRIRIGIEEERD
jgi:mutual gliding-motility protein MglA